MAEEYLWVDRAIESFHRRSTEPVGGIYLGNEEWTELRASRNGAQGLSCTGPDQYSYHGVPVYLVRAKNHMKVTD